MREKETKKVLVLTDMDHDLEAIVHQETGIPLENMLTLQSYGSVISQPFGEIMRSVVIGIYQENIEEVIVVGVKDQSTNFPIQHRFQSIENKVQALEYLFQHCKPELTDNSLEDWLNGKENVRDNVENSIHMIRSHPLIPSHVKVRGLLVNKEEKSKVVEVS